MTDNADPKIIPVHPHLRRKPLPWEELKAKEEEPDVLKRVNEILESPSYRLAYQDADFLEQDETRGLRLQIDYLKAELLLKEHGIEHTIVVFGSTRISEPDTSKRKIDKLLAELSAKPGNPNLERQLEIAKRIRDKSRYYEVAREFGQIVGNSGEGPQDNRVVIMTGGGPGIMEAANRGSFDVGARSVGLNITLPHEQFPNPYVTSNLCFRFHYFAIRKLHFLLRAKALVVFPGGYGTLDELLETLTLIQTREMQPVPVVLVGEHYWRRALDINFLTEEGVIDEEDRELFWYAESAEEAWRGILTWHERNGTPLFI